jgi:hypothetical protein
MLDPDAMVAQRAGLRVGVADGSSGRFDESLKQASSIHRVIRRATRRPAAVPGPRST